MPLRDQILRAATELYAETGFRGATTRQIAQRAGVNEVTLFRHFGSKNALLSEAVRCACTRPVPGSEATALPEVPRAVREELLAWAQETWQGLWARRGVLRTALAESEAHPGLYPKANSTTACAGRELAGYLERCRAADLVHGELDVGAATATLMGTLFADALTRDVLPLASRREPAQALLAYVELFLRAIGAEDHETSLRGPAARSNPVADATRG